MPNYVWGIISCIVAAAVFLLIALLWMNRGEEPASSGQGAVSSVSSAMSQVESNAVSSEESALQGETIDMPT
mgnify:FL=1